MPCIDYDKGEFITFTKETWNEFAFMFKAYAGMQRIPVEVIDTFYRLEER